MKSRWILPVLGLSLSVVCVRGNPTYNVNVAPPGYTLFGNQLDLSPSDLPNTMLGQMLPIKSQVLAWNGTTFITSEKTPGGWTVPSMTIMRGEGFFCKVPPTAGTLSIPFTGTKSTTPTPISVFTPTTVWYLLGSQTYAEDVTPGAKYSYYDITGYSIPAAGASVYRSKYAVPGFNPTVSSPIDSPLDWNEYVYDGTSWQPFDPEIVLGEGVWVGPSTGNGGACEITGTVTDNLGNPLPNWEMSLSDGQYTFTDANGIYRFAVLSGEYTVAQIPPCGWATLTDPQSVTINCPGPVVQVPQPFRAISNGINTGPDLAVFVIYVPDPGNPNYPCPNDTGYYSVHYYNKCGPTMPAGTTLNVTLSPYVSYGSSVNASWSQTPPVGGSLATALSINPPTLSWTLGALPVSAIGEIRIPVTIASQPPLAHPPPPHNYTALTTIATIPYAGDADQQNNVYNMQTVAKCSFDPNDKTVEPAGCGPTGLINGNQPLTYTVQFQNLGSAPAFDVAVTDQLDPSLDLSTLKILGASHNYVFQLNGHQMTWLFPHIYLPDATDNEPGSHGYSPWICFTLLTISAKEFRRSPGCISIFAGGEPRKSDRSSIIRMNFSTHTGSFHRRGAWILPPNLSVLKREGSVCNM